MSKYSRSGYRRMVVVMVILLAALISGSVLAALGTLKMLFLGQLF